MRWPSSAETLSEAACRGDYPSGSMFYRCIKDNDAAGKRVEGKIVSHYPVVGIQKEAVCLFEGGLSRSEAPYRLGVFSLAALHH